VPPTNIVGAVQARYAAQTWSGKPTNLVFGTAWPRDGGGNLTSYPVVLFTHSGTPADPLFSRQVLQHWRFQFRAFADDTQKVEAVYAGVMWDGQAPGSGLGSGFWHPDDMEVPAGYLFKHFAPTGPFNVESLDGVWSPTGSPLCRATWDMELFVHRVSFG
jgi:hypothetical protein